MADKVLIWCLERKMYWKDNNIGYTEELAEAGLYHRGKAESICKNANAHGEEEERIIELDDAFTSLQRMYNQQAKIHLNQISQIQTPIVVKNSDNIKLPEKKEQTCWECGVKFMGYRDECLDCFRERKDLPR